VCSRIPAVFDTAVHTECIEWSGSVWHFFCQGHALGNSGQWVMGGGIYSMYRDHGVPGMYRDHGVPGMRARIYSLKASERQSTTFRNYKSDLYQSCKKQGKFWKGESHRECKRTVPGHSDVIGHCGVSNVLFLVILMSLVTMVFLRVRQWAYSRDFGQAQTQNFRRHHANG